MASTFDISFIMKSARSNSLKFDASVQTFFKLKIMWKIPCLFLLCLDNDLAPEGKPGVNSILNWVFAEFPSHKKNKLYSDFWQEIIDRCKEEDVSGWFRFSPLLISSNWWIIFGTKNWVFATNSDF